MYTALADIAAGGIGTAGCLARGTLLIRAFA
jgi:hypothetical protein